MLLAIDRRDEEERTAGLFGWLVPASILLHVVLVGVLPSAPTARHGSPPKTALVLEMAVPAAPPPPLAEAHDPEPAPPTRSSKKLVAAPPTTKTSAAHAPADEARPPPTTNDAPVDFTGMTFSNDGPGVVVTGGGAAPSRPASATSLAGAPSPARAASFVPAGSLGRAPRAPGLDRELERNYPSDARRSGISGAASLRLELLADGRVGKVEHVSETYAGFGRACERTVRGGRWEPPLDRDGRPVATEIKYVCKFEAR